MTTSSHLSCAVGSLEEATLHFANAVRTGEFMHHHTWYLERLDLLKRAAANLRKKLQDINQEPLQWDLFQ